jgi:hypothetical protein
MSCVCSPRTSSSIDVGGIVQGQETDICTT